MEHETFYMLSCSTTTFYGKMLHLEHEGDQAQTFVFFPAPYTSVPPLHTQNLSVIMVGINLC